MAAVDDVVAVGALLDRDRWERGAAAVGERDPLPARPEVLRGRSEAGVEVRAWVHGADDRGERDDVEPGGARGPRGRLGPCARLAATAPAGEPVRRAGRQLGAAGAREVLAGVEHQHSCRGGDERPEHAARESLRRAT
jgi:hypothetical protein